MNKLANAPVKDPIQGHLRGSKSVWNHEASDVISKIIALKRGLNGRGDNKAGLPASRITMPIPSEVSSYLRELVSSFSAMVDGASKIIEEQHSYSEGRAQASIEKQKEFIKIASILEMEAEELAKQAEVWWGWGNQLVNHFSLLGKEDRALKLKLLRALLNLKEEIKDFEELLLDTHKPESLPGAFTKIGSIVYGYTSSFLTSFKSFLQNQELPLSNEGEPGIFEKYELFKLIFNKLQELAPKMEKLNKIEELPSEDKNLVQQFKKILSLFDRTSKLLNKNPNYNFSDLLSEKETIKKYLDLAEKYSGQIAKQANLIRKLYNELKLNLNPSNEDLVRLDIINRSRKLREEIHLVYSAISQREATLEQAAPVVRDLNLKLVDLLELILSLGKKYTLDYNHQKDTGGKGPLKFQIYPRDLTRVREALMELKKYV